MGTFVFLTDLQPDLPFLVPKGRGVGIALMKEGPHCEEKRNEPVVAVTPELITLISPHTH